MHSSKKEFLKKYYTHKEVLDILQLSLDEFDNLIKEYEDLKIVKIRGRRYCKGEELQKLISNIGQADILKKNIGRTQPALRDCPVDISNTSLSGGYKQFSFFDEVYKNSKIQAFGKLEHIKAQLEISKHRLVSMLSN